MATINPPQVNPNDAIVPSLWNNPINEIADEFNGNIDDANIKANAAIATSKLASDNGITSGMLSTTAITLGYAQITTSFSSTATPTLTDVTSLTVTVTVPAGGRRIRVSFGSLFCAMSGAAGQNLQIALIDVTGGVQIGGKLLSNTGANFGLNLDCMVSHVPAAGSRTYKVQIAQSAAGTMSINAAVATPAFILVEAI